MCVCVCVCVRVCERERERERGIYSLSFIKAFLKRPMEHYINKRQGQNTCSRQNGNFFRIANFLKIQLLLWRLLILVLYVIHGPGT